MANKLLVSGPVPGVRNPRKGISGRTPFGPRVFADAPPGYSVNDSGWKNRRPRADEYIGDPIHLNGSVTALQVGSQGAGVNVKALRNPGPGAMEIFGLKFRLRATVAPITGAIVGCRLDLGDYPLTNGFVPVYAFGRAENLVMEQTSDGTFSIGASSPVTYAEYIARLARPIYVPKGAAIRPQLQHRGITSQPVDVQVSMFGRMLPVDAPPPDQLMLPYWASYTSKTFVLGTADTDTSSEGDLYNPFEVPLEMERFVGRISFFSTSGFVFTNGSMVELETSRFISNNTSLVTGLIGDPFGQIFAQIVDSNGFPVVRKNTPFRLIFDAETRSWPLKHQLPPGGYYLVNMTNTAFLGGSPANVISLQPCISMLGWRSIEGEAGAGEDGTGD